MSVLRQEHDGCDQCTLAVLSQPGRGVQIVDRRTGGVLLDIKVLDDNGHWFIDALRVAFDHSRQSESADRSPEERS